VLVTEKPNPKLKGMVNQRDSSYFKAMDKARKQGVQIMSAYCFSKIRNGKTGQVETDKQLTDSLTASLTALGLSFYPAFEYYLEDNSAVLGYRIYSPMLEKRCLDAANKLLPPGTTEKKNE
jgi:hypothetical protein